MEASNLSQNFVWRLNSRNSKCISFVDWPYQGKISPDPMQKGVSSFLLYTNMNKINSLHRMKKHPKISKLLQFESYSSKSFKVISDLRDLYGNKIQGLSSLDSNFFNLHDWFYWYHSKPSFQISISVQFQRCTWTSWWSIKHESEAGFTQIPQTWNSSNFESFTSMAFKLQELASVILLHTSLVFLQIPAQHSTLTSALFPYKNPDRDSHPLALHAPLARVRRGASRKSIDCPPVVLTWSTSLSWVLHKALREISSQVSRGIRTGTHEDHVNISSSVYCTVGFDGGNSSSGHDMPWFTRERQVDQGLLFHPLSIHSGHSFLYGILCGLSSPCKFECGFSGHGKLFICRC